MKNPNAAANLTKKGAQANPNGRPPKGYSITEYFREMIASQPEKKKKLVNAIFEKALQGDVSAQKMIWQYMDGQAPQTINHAGVIGSLNLQDDPDALKTLFATYSTALKNTDEK